MKLRRDSRRPRKPTARSTSVVAIGGGSPGNPTARPAASVAARTASDQTGQPACPGRPQHQGQAVPRLAGQDGEERPGGGPVPRPPPPTGQRQVDHDVDDGRRGVGRPKHPQVARAPPRAMASATKPAKPHRRPPPPPPSPGRGKARPRPRGGPRRRRRSGPRPPAPSRTPAARPAGGRAGQHPGLGPCPPGAPPWPPRPPPAGHRPPGRGRSVPRHRPVPVRPTRRWTPASPRRGGR